ncbi:Uncharacterized protein dnl_30820 [Desulfonema limicola]|uniref:ATP-binding protein n=1 Tax=Desulfonema limicola TaxID=45656 RepID=A0A975B8J9_9BACT|nr:hypothetical protein [Desulfonema limicola]QTA80769.1 Uncharacterized protein dnl_30820 [Desulfonema limicola]
MSDNVKIFGDYVELDNVKEYMVISFSANTLAIDELWDSSALSARFLSGFWGNFFPKTGLQAGNIRNDVKDSVRYIAAELLGNAVKFSFLPEFIIKIGLYMINGELRFYVTNSVAPNHIDEFQDFIQTIMSHDPNDLYLQQMEKNAEQGNMESRMGFLTMILDYESLIAWKFGKDDGIDTVTTLVRLPIVRKK